MNRTRLAISVPLLLLLDAYLLWEAWPLAKMVWAHAGLYRWVALGVVVCLVLLRLMRKNAGFLKTLTHELTHLVVGLGQRRKIASLEVKENEGVVWSAGSEKGRAFLSLSPYCLPIYTLALLLLWSCLATRSVMAGSGLVALDLLVGASIAFHAVCFWEQTSREQTDISRFPIFFSYLFIHSFRLLNLYLILLSYLPGRDPSAPMRLWGAVWYLLQHFWIDLVALF